MKYLLYFGYGALLFVAGIPITNWIFWPLAAMIPLAYLIGKNDAT